eukprot:7996168-Pyramimonas_sp.AAC.1
MAVSESSELSRCPSPMAALMTAWHGRRLGPPWTIPLSPLPWVGTPAVALPSSEDSRSSGTWGP